MTRRFTSFLSALVLALTIVFASSTFVAGTEPTEPHRSVDGGSASFASGVVACEPAVLTAAESSVPAAPVAPPSIQRPAITVEQDAGAVFVLTTDLSTAEAGTLADGTVAGCPAPILPEDQPFSSKPR